jgi:hypothetical protein
MIQGIGQIERDVSGLKVAREMWTLPQYVIFAVVLVAAAAALLSAGMLMRKKSVSRGQVEPKSPPV